MQEENNGRDVAAFPQQRNGVMQGLYGRLKTKGCRVRNQPPRMIREQAFRDAPCVREFDTQPERSPANPPARPTGSTGHERSRDALVRQAR